MQSGTYTHTNIHTCIPIYIHTNINTYIHTYIHTYIKTYKHTYIHTYIHTFTFPNSNNYLIKKLDMKQINIRRNITH